MAVFSTSQLGSLHCSDGLQSLRSIYIRLWYNVVFLINQGLLRKGQNLKEKVIITNISRKELRIVNSSQKHPSILSPKFTSLKLWNTIIFHFFKPLDASFSLNVDLIRLCGAQLIKTSGDLLKTKSLRFIVELIRWMPTIEISIRSDSVFRFLWK